MRLRDIRTRLGLTQDEVAARIGLQGNCRREQVGRLERGRNSNPSLKLVTLYLRSCGARIEEISDLLNRLEPLLPPRVPAEKTNLTPEEIEQIEIATRGDAGKYQRHVQYPRAGTPPRPAVQRKRAERWQEYQLQLRISLAAVKRYFVNACKNLGDWYKYSMLTQRFLGALRRYEGARREEKLAAITDYCRRQGFDLELAGGVQRVVTEQYERLTQGTPSRANGSTAGGAVVADPDLPDLERQHEEGEPG